MCHAIQNVEDFSFYQKETAQSIQKSESGKVHLHKNSITSKSTLAVSWLPMPLDQNWEMTSSNVWPLTTLKAKLLAAGEGKVTAASHFKGLCSGHSWDRINVNKITVSWQSFKPQVIPEQHPHKIFLLCRSLMFSSLLRPKLHHAALWCIFFLYGLVKQKTKSK